MSPRFALVIRYVDHPRRSAAFYSSLLGAPPIEQSDTFAMLPLSEGVALGLWSRATVSPAVRGSAGAGEIDFMVASRTALEAAFADWSGKAAVIQPVLTLEFGTSFVIADPDGHRIRVLLPAEPPAG